MRHTGIVVTCAVVLAGGAGDARAQLNVGPQLSIGTDSGVGLGGRLGFPLRTGALGLDGVLDGNYFFGGPTGVDSWIDANVNLRIPIPLAEDFTTRLGAGVNFAFISFEQAGPTTRTDTEVGLNVLATIEFGRRGIAGVTPFGELRVVAGGAEQVVFTGGILFGPRR